MLVLGIALADDADHAPALDYLFFFSSRRRHPRCSRDWSSDVCSSDLRPSRREGIDHFVRLRVAPNGDPFLPFAKGGFGTATGKCEFRAETLEYTPPVESRHGERRLRAKYPLELISPKNDDSMNSTFGNREDTDRDTSVIKIHERDA